MKKRRGIIYFVLIPIIILSSSTAWAAGNTRPLVGIEEGGINFAFAPILSFSNISPLKQRQQLKTSFVQSFEMEDNTGKNQGYYVALSVSIFQSEKGQLPLGSLRIEAPERIETSSGTLLHAPQLIKVPSALDGIGSMRLLQADSGQGAGQYLITYPKDALTLLVPSKIKKGIYRSTFTYSLISGP